MKTFITHLINWKRFETVLWYSGAMVLADLVKEVIANLSTYHLSTTLTVLLGIVLAQISKALTNYLADHAVDAPSS